jgi:hypothetical protein
VATPEAVLDDVSALVGSWCDRRCFRALREILQGWPMVSGLTDDWGNLYEALERVRALAKPELTKEEAIRVENAIHVVGEVLLRRIGGG